jgi:hypothetical protein
MQQRSDRWSWFIAVGAVLALGMAAPAAADITSDRAAAILMWPDVFYSQEVGEDDPEITDTIIQLSNTSAESILVHCFYENANSHCSNTGDVCTVPELDPDEADSAADCCTGESCGVCRPGWVETDFRIRLTPRQPLGWRASEGRSSFPLSGAPGSTGPDGSSNAGSRIPPLPENPYTGLLKCVAINDDGTPSDRNVLKGEASLVVYEAGGADSDDDDSEYTIAKYNAIGVEAIEGNVNDDSQLVLGGPDAEYNGCPNFLILNHHFDLGENPVTGEEMNTRLVLVPCTQDLLRQIPGTAIVQYLVYNEFEQRFSTSRAVDCKFEEWISQIDTTDPDRSIFSAGVSGTQVGQTRMNPIGSGLLGVAVEFQESDRDDLAAFNLHYQGDRPDPDLITLP